MHGVFGIDSSSNVYVLDWWRGQKTSDVWIDAKCDLIKKLSRCAVLAKRGRWLSSIADMATRCRAFQAMASMGRVRLPAKAK